MKKTFLCAIITAFAVYAFGQQHQAEKIERELKGHPQQDTFRVNRLVELFRLTMPTAGRLDTMANEALTISKKLNYDGGRVEGLRMLAVVYYRKNNLPQATLLLDQALAIAKTIKDRTYLSDAYASMASFSNLTGDQKHALAYSLKAEEAAQTTQNKILIAQRQNGISGLYANSIGDYTKSMEWAIKAEKNADEAGDLNAQALSWSNMAGIYTSIGDQSTSLIYYQKALDANKRLGNLSLEFNLLNRIGEMYRLSGRYQKALAAYKEGLSKTTLTYNTELTESNMADVYVRLGDLPMAFKYGFKSLHEAQSIDDAEGEEWIEGILARAYLKRNMPDSAIYYAQTGYSKSVKTGTIEFKRDNSKALADAYAMKKNYDDAYRYHLLFISYRDSMVNADVTNQASLLQYNYNLAKKQAQIVTLSQQKKMQYYFLAGSAGILLVVGSMGLILFRNNRQKQKANLLLSKQKREIETQRDQTNKALTELQITQNQLVQREKMASLGELTAGIAHEIQNPLNFVNNFAEVNIELLEELKEADAKGDKKEVSVLANDLAQNLEKIRQHGKRADGIVKGMLQHSRASTGQKEPTDL
ncbi:MAG TPA: tetratricopeptide repeat protein, partial [Mucilaginibacter sp.]|nr:tetratricopeptide repeat protein [Mucilaginibacter sp.]